MKTMIIIISILLLVLTASADTYISGNWSGIVYPSGNPYRITGNVTVPSGQFLTLAPGVEVRFMGHYKITVNGGMTAWGFPTDSVTFVYDVGPIPGGWQFIEFNSSWVDSAQFTYCRIQSGERAILANNRHIILEHCLISGHGMSPLKGTSNALFSLDSCVVSYNAASGITLDNSNATVMGCTITYNSGVGDGIYATNGGTIQVNGGIIAHNLGSGIFTQGIASANISNVEIASNGGSGINMSTTTGNLTGSRTVIHDNGIHGIYLFTTSLQANNFTISSNNSDGMFFSGTNKAMDLSSSIIDHNGSWGVYMQTGIAILGYNDAYLNIDGNYGNCSQGQGSIQEDPQYTTWPGRNFNLLSISPCIDTGSPFDPLDPDGTVTDMGAFYFNQSGVNPISPPLQASDFRIVSAYPNPFNPTITIRVNLPRPIEAQLIATDLQGRVVSDIFQGRLSAGVQDITWNAAEQPSGIYFVTFKTAQQTQVNTMLTGQINP